MIKSFNRLTFAVTIVTLSSVAPTAALAVKAENVEDALESNSEFEVITVSARKKGKGESAQKVPISLTGMSGEMIERRFVKDLTDVGNIAPNVKLTPVGSLPGTAGFFIRGMGVFSSIPSDESAVGVIVDGVYLGVNAGSLTNLFDTETVEILRGPQGTLFGRNVTGGAVVVSSRRPAAELDFKARVRIGTDGERSFDIATGNTLSDDVLGRVALGYQKNGDYFENVAGPNRGEATSRYIRPSVTFQVNEDLDITFIAEYSDFDGDGVVSRNVNSDLTGTLGDHQVISDLDSQAEYEINQLIADVDWRLGEGTLKFIGSWRSAEVGAELDADGTNLENFKVHSNDPWLINQEQTSLELRYYTPISDIAEMTVGGFYFSQDIDYSESRTINTPATPNFDIFQGAGGILDHYSWALFAQGDINITESLTISLGSRYTYEEKEADVASFGSCDDFGKNCNYDFSNKDDWSFISAYTGLNWSINKDLNAYSSWTRSFRSGGYNLRNTAPNSPGPYNEEQLDAYEIGFKTEWPEYAIRFNSSLFYNDYTDLQRTIQTSGSSGVIQTKLNAADATIKGIEIEFSILLFEGLRIDLSGGLLDAKYDRFEGGDVNFKLPNVPEKSGNISITYNTFIGEGELEGRWSTTYTDSQAGDVSNTAAIDLDEYTFSDASLAYILPSGNTRVSLYVKNITDKEYVNFALGGLNTYWGLSKPRQVGIEVSYQY
ncbi:TonB-dependent receptor [Alteromonas sp. M12]|uniref:TonB-dependent receptor n=1 Tax=Alteromonas sp. M12 TaxID=3135644 RepID=UPI00319E23CA